jgi:peroxiredoxin
MSSSFTEGNAFMYRCAIAVLLAVGLASGSAWAGKYNRKLNLGSPAPAFKDLEGVDGKKYSLEDFKDKDAVVVVITCNECPVAGSYENRIIAFSKKYENKVAVVAVNVCLGEEESLPRMKARAQKKGFNFVYLRDPSQQVGRAYGASKTPEFFALDKERKVAYMGALDDDLRIAKVKEKYLENAIEAILKGEKPTLAETPAFGCGIEYRKRKD